MNRLRELRKKANLKQKDIANIAGVTISAVSQWESGKNNIDWRAATLLSEYLNATPEHILGEVDGTDKKENPNQGVSLRIPILSTVRAGNPVAAIEEIEGWEEIPISLAKTGEFVALRVKGNSMEPIIINGDIAIIRRQETIENGEVAVVTIGGDDATLKKVKLFKNEISLVPFNSFEYEELRFSAHEIAELPVRIYGKLIEIRRKF